MAKQAVVLKSKVVLFMQFQDADRAAVVERGEIMLYRAVGEDQLGEKSLNSNHRTHRRRQIFHQKSSPIQAGGNLDAQCSCEHTPPSVCLCLASTLRAGKYVFSSAVIGDGFRRLE